MEKLIYNTLEFKNGKFSDEAAKSLVNMLKVWDDGHVVFICHPDHIFLNPRNKETKDIDEIDWDDIDPSKMLTIGDIKQFCAFDNCDDTFRYAFRRFQHNMLKLSQIKPENEIILHLVVVERDRYHNYLVRGIMRADMNGLAVTFNNEYITTIPTNIFMQTLRLCGDDNQDHNFRKQLKKKVTKQ